MVNLHNPVALLEKGEKREFSQRGEPRTTRKGTVFIGAESLIWRYRAKNLPDRHDILRVGFSVGIQGDCGTRNSEKRPSSEA